jgi:3-deoxy-D-manno-octulosonic acid kinase
VKPAAPPPFAALATAGATWWADARMLDELCAAGWLEPRRVREALAGARGAAGRAPVALVAAGATRLVLRDVRHGGALGPWLGRALAGPERPLAELAVTQRLRDAGAPVARPVFAGAWRRGCLWNGVVATELESEALDGDRFLRRGPDRVALARALEAAGRAVRRFHDAGGSHPDLHVKNLLVRERAGACDVLVIDLDRARALPRVGAEARMAQLMRLYRSLVKRELVAAVGRRGCARFLHAYVAGDRALRRALLARLPAEQRKLRWHRLLYRSS